MQTTKKLSRSDLLTGSGES